MQKVYAIIKMQKVYAIIKTLFKTPPFYIKNLFSLLSKIKTHK